MLSPANYMAQVGGPKVYSVPEQGMHPIPGGKTLFLQSFEFMKRPISLFLILVSIACSVALGQDVDASPKIKRLLFSDSESAVLQLSPAPEEGPIIVKGIPLLQTAEFSQQMEAFVGKPISSETINSIAIKAHEYIKKMDRLILSVKVPQGQDVQAGDLRMVLILGRYKDLIFQGNKYFSNKLLQDKLGINPGDEVRLSTLEEAINWTNNNPFRRVKVFINDLRAADPGKADLIVAVDEVMPLKLGASYDNSGSEIIGANHYSVSIQYGNLWGKDHIATYQYTTTDALHLYQVHSIDYRAPLPWRHYIQFQGAYSRINPSLWDGNGAQLGESILGSLRYLAPMSFKGFTLELSAGLDFKESNNDYEFGGERLPTTTNDIFQGSLGATVVRKDNMGAWSLAASVNLSPGGINSRNTDNHYEAARVYSNATYATSIVSLQRLVTLPWDMQTVFTGTMQRASTNLLGQELMTIGGTGTVRGYDERILASDEGFVANMEIHGPLWSTPVKFLPKLEAPLQYRPIAFVDYGHVYSKHLTGNSLIDLPTPALSSAGIGLRCWLGYRFSLTCDYGWQLRRVAQSPNAGRGHIRVSLAY